jgi:transglutaminase-like putative cysteine protease
MITHNDAEQRIERWLEATAPVGSADRVLAETLDRTRRMAQGSGQSRRFPSIRPRPVALAVAAALILAAVSLGIRRTDLAQAAPLGSIDGQRWVDSPDVAVMIQRDPSDDRDFYWRAAAYDRIDTIGMSISHPNTTTRPPATSLFNGMADDVDPAGLRRLTFTVRPVSITGSMVLSPATPVEVDRAVRLTTVGTSGFFAMVERDGRDPYTVTALVPAGAGALGTADESALRAAGTSYPPEVVALYAAEVPGMFGPNLGALRDEIVRTAHSKAPIDLANRLMQVLGGPRYRYDVDLHDVDCGSMSAPECFATSRRGFCVQYAMTMAVVLRDLGVPARVVEGFLPGQRRAYPPLEVILNSNAHAWVEVYFPGHGWVAFDPTSRLPSRQFPLPAPLNGSGGPGA